MATEDQIKDAQEALINAHNAGDEQAAQRIADHIVSLQSQQKDVPPETTDRTLGDVAGAAVGGLGGAAFGRSLQSGIREEYPNLFRGASSAGIRAESPEAMQRYLNSQVAMRGVKGTVPLESLARAAAVPTESLTMPQIQAALKETLPTPPQRIVKETPTGGKISKFIPAAEPKINLASLVEAEPAAAKPASSITGKIGEALKTANRNVGHVLHGMTNPWAIKTLANALGGASTGLQAVDAYQRLTDPNQGFIRGAISGLGALGSGAAMTRIPAAMPIGLAVGTAAPIANEFLDQWAKEHPEAAKRLHLADGGSVNNEHLMQMLKAARLTRTTNSQLPQLAQPMGYPTGGLSNIK